MNVTPPAPPENRNSFYHQAATCCLLAPIVGAVMNVFLVRLPSLREIPIRWVFFIPSVVILAGVVLGVISLFGIRKHGRRGILWKSVIGLGIVTLMILLLL